jgi:hypothetical protein
MPRGAASINPAEWQKSFEFLKKIKIQNVKKVT